MHSSAAKVITATAAEAASRSGDIMSASDDQNKILFSKVSATFGQQKNVEYSILVCVSVSLIHIGWFESAGDAIARYSLN